MMWLLDLLPPQLRYPLDRLAASRLCRDDRGEVGIVGTIIMVVGFAVAAGILVAAIKGKLQSWIAKIPG
jgi:hypothetical protein